MLTKTDQFLIVAARKQVEQHGIAVFDQEITVGGIRAEIVAPIWLRLCLLWQ